MAGGINDRGSYRNIKHFREGKLLQQMDLYDFLIYGKTADDVPLANGDVLLVEVYGNRVELQGAVKRPGILN